MRVKKEIQEMEQGLENRANKHLTQNGVLSLNDFYDIFVDLAKGYTNKED